MYTTTSYILSYQLRIVTLDVEIERETVVAFGRTGGGCNTSTPEERMWRTTRSSPATDLEGSNERHTSTGVDWE
jgi:hypothetical protein